MPINYSRPLMAEAREWASDHPDQPVSCFASRYPGRYREAADLARAAREALQPPDEPTEQA